MDDKAKVLAKLIDKKGVSRRAFAEEAGIPPTTLQSMLQRGVGRASIDNVIKVCRLLGITVEQLEEMAEMEGKGLDPMKRFHTIAAHRSDDPTDELPEEARRSLEDFKRFLLRKHGLLQDDEE